MNTNTGALRKAASADGRGWTTWLRILIDPGLQQPSLLGGAASWTVNGAQALGALAARLYVAHVFFLSGLTKIRDWEITLALFEDEYHVPLLPPELAAWMGTGGELVLPVLLVLGLGGRFAALGLSVVNLMAVLSLSDIAPAALVQHQLWGGLLLGLALYGPGRLSLDAVVASHLRCEKGRSGR
ncbi:DoxX family protein [Roseateles amylovorans]|uniref:DoxX family protein n=1 Tax=Roseateles amylovorans TaxID=2978473 RepID=A0ABY6B4J7_9BURK|nr:DoxX family protein [Roseateles amylovorans]UXH80293.1 DoxX family protein [Roseateles amylovorans]